MKKEIKYILFIIILFLVGCASERGSREREYDRIRNLTYEERIKEKKECIKKYERAINNTPNEKKYCTFWRCYLGKEDFKGMLWSCISGLNKITKENTGHDFPKISYIEREKIRIRNLTDEERAKEKQGCVERIERNIRNAPEKKKGFSIFQQPLNKDDWRDMIKNCNKYDELKKDKGKDRKYN